MAHVHSFLCVSWYHAIHASLYECLYICCSGDVQLMEYEMERIMEQLEMRCYDGLQAAMKTTEGIGIEYDEDVVCDICRSVGLLQLCVVMVEGSNNNNSNRCINLQPSSQGVGCTIFLPFAMLLR